DFEKGFLRAAVMPFADYVAHKSEAGCRSAGVFCVEGKYVMHDGDVMHFRFNVQRSVTHQVPLPVDRRGP
ncbi:MAG: DUF933 domain-containing protein, partial [Candidatus Binatia bacterium]